MAYIGSTPTTQSFISGTDYFNGTGSQTSFTLSRPVGSVNDIQAVVNNVVQVPNDAYNVSGTSIVFTSAPSAGTGNVYVRYLSTTTQSITPSQNTVSYATWNSDLRNQTFAFKNRLINGDMNIDQRGSASTPVSNGAAANTYFTDRWCMFGTVAARMNARQSTVAPSGFTNSALITSLAATTPGSGDAYGIRQIIEGFNTADLGWGTANAQTVTVSFWVRSSITGTYSFSPFNDNTGGWRTYVATYTINAADTWEYKTLTIPGDTGGTWNKTNGQGIQCWWDLGSGTSFNTTAGAWNGNLLVRTAGSVNWIGTSGATFYITAVQFEKGTTATNFDVLPYTTELQLCQRYFVKFGGEVSSEVVAPSGIGASTTSGQFFNLYPVRMRTQPTVAFNSLTLADTVNPAVDVTSISFGTSVGSSQISSVSMFVASGVAANRPLYARTANSTGFLSYSAEL
jgi:hypothetical protein